MIFTIAKHELRSLLFSPLSWSVLAIVQALLAYFFIIYLEYFMQVQAQLTAASGSPGLTELVVAPLFITAATIFLLVVPLLTMRLISEEHRSKTISLLLTAPISMIELILGKYLGIVAFLLAMLLLVGLMPLALLIGGNLDFGLYLSGLLGLILVVASFAALGLYMSTLTTHPTLAALSAFGVLLFLWIMELSVSATDSGSLFQYISMLHHYTPLMKGVFNSSDVIYYLLFISCFLALSVKRMDSLRLSR